MSLTLDPSGNDFILRRTEPTGAVSEITLSGEDVPLAILPVGGINQPERPPDVPPYR
jgi:hypothetical protein